MSAGITLRVVEALLESLLEVEIDVVVGSKASSLQMLHELAWRNPQIHLHVDAMNMAELMVMADLSIGAPGSTSWERCCLGLPTIMIVLAENQTAIGQALVENGVGLMAGEPDDGPARAAEIARALIGNRDRLNALSEQNYRLKVGEDTAIIASYLLKERLTAKRGE